MPTPNLVIVGAMKAGTSSLHQYLSQHPDIYMAEPKEPQYFSFADGTLDFPVPDGEDASINEDIVPPYTLDDLTLTWDDYSSIFVPGADFRIRGESSTWYLYSLGAAQRIKDTIPDAKIIVLLRNPIKRAYSAYQHFIRQGRDMPDAFLKFMQLDVDRSHPEWVLSWHMKQMGLYATQIARYKQLFPDEQLRIYIFELDYKDNLGSLLADIISFLEIDPSHVIDTSIRHNVGGLPKTTYEKIMYRIMLVISRYYNPIKPLIPKKLYDSAVKFHGSLLSNVPMKAEDYEVLKPFYSEDIKQLENLLNRDLAIWQ